MKIGCQITYSSIKVNCDTFRNRESNLACAWSKLVDELWKRKWKVPRTKNSFIRSGGSVSWYKSY